MKQNYSNIIQSLESLLKNDSKIDLIIEKIHELVSVSQISQGSFYNPGIELYRTTNHHISTPQSISDLWFPPKEFAKLSRANLEGVPIFYCSPDPSSTFLEIGIGLGQYCVHAKWTTTKELMVQDLGYIKDVFSRAKSPRELTKEQEEFEKKHISEIHRYIHLAFTEAKNPIYKLTAAIAEVHLRADFIHGIKYPGIKKSSRADNLAIIPNFVENSLKLQTAQLIKVDELGDDFSIGGETLADLVEVKPDGRLLWDFRNKGEPIPPGGSTILKTGISTVQQFGLVTIDSLQYNVQPGFTIENQDNKNIIVRNLKGDIVKPISSQSF